MKQLPGVCGLIHVIRMYLTELYFPQDFSFNLQKMEALERKGTKILA